MSWALMAVAGGLGALARLEVSAVLARRWPTAPWGTRVVNLVGAACLGLLVGAGTSAAVLRVAGTGFLGGFTTFSTWMVDASKEPGWRSPAEAILPLLLGVTVAWLAGAGR